MVLMLGVGGQGEEWGSEGGGKLERELTSHHWSPFSGPCVEVSCAEESFIYICDGIGWPFPPLPTHFAI